MKKTCYCLRPLIYSMNDGKYIYLISCPVFIFVNYSPAILTTSFSTTACSKDLQFYRKNRNFYFGLRDLDWHKAIGKSLTGKQVCNPDQIILWQTNKRRWWIFFIFSNIPQYSKSIFTETSPYKRFLKFCLTPVNIDLW